MLIHDQASQNPDGEDQCKLNPIIVIVTYILLYGILLLYIIYNAVMDWRTVKEDEDEIDRYTANHSMLSRSSNVSASGISS